MMKPIACCTSRSILALEMLEGRLSASRAGGSDGSCGMSPGSSSGNGKRQKARCGRPARRWSQAIDRQAAAERITVVNTPEANVESVAEQCLGMMIVLAKRMRLADRAIRAGDWESRYRLIGNELLGKTLGLVGFGRIGQRLAAMCHLGLSMRLLYHDVVAYPEAEANLGAQRVELDRLLRESDFVSLHTPLTAETRGLIGESALRSMKPTAFLINTARGQVVDQAALVQALQLGWIAGAGLDVYDPEPLPADHPLLRMENIVLSPHMASHTDEALLRMAMVVNDVLAVIEGRQPVSAVT
jgi:phosphoglycerate dehydrogenase-like enzyme